jgi:hypothetical protein
MLPAWSRRLPVRRTYDALRQAQEKLAATRTDLRRTREERDFARKLTSHLLSRGQLKDIARERTEAYQSADPFPHVVLDNAFDPAILKEILREFDGMDRGPWHNRAPATAIGPPIPKPKAIIPICSKLW